MKEKVPLKKELIEGLSYILLPGKSLRANSDHPQAYRVYQYWKEFWGGFYQSVKSEEQLRADEFMRQDVVAALLQGDRVVGLHTYCFFDLESASTRDHSYFGLYTDLDFHQLKKQGFRKLMTMEFLTTHSDWRKSLIGLSLAEVLVGCGIKVLQAAELDASITIARKDYKVPDFAERVGFRTLRAGLVRHNCPCELMVCPAQNPEQTMTSETSHYVDYFWKRRQDFTELTTPHQERSNGRRAA
jgi:hypothetical protein